MLCMKGVSAASHSPLAVLDGMADLFCRCVRRPCTLPNLTDTVIHCLYTFTYTIPVLFNLVFEVLCPALCCAKYLYRAGQHNVFYGAISDCHPYTHPYMIPIISGLKCSHVAPSGDMLPCGRSGAYGPSREHIPYLSMK